MPTIRLPLSWPFNPRSATTAKDQHRVNVVDEILGERVFTLKRPGITNYLSYTPGVGQGMTSFNDGVYSVIGDRVNVSSTVPSGASGSAWQADAVAAWEPRALMGIGNLNGTIYLIGGARQNGAFVNSDVWQLTSSNAWLQCVASAPWAARGDMMIGTIGDTMYMMGGGLGDDLTFFNDVWSSKNGVDWIEVTAAAAWSKREGAAVISADNGMYLLGGDPGNAGARLNDIWFSTDGKTWNQVLANASWAARSGAQAYYYNNKLWIAGGYNNGIFPAGTGLKDVWSSSDAGRTWQQATADAWGGTARFAAGALVYQNKIWLINGHDGTAPRNTVFSSVDGATWTTVTTSGPWAPSWFGGVYLAPAPPGMSAFNYQTMYWVGGWDAATIASKVVYHATLDVTLAAGTVLTTATANQPMQFSAFNTNNQLLLKNQSNLWVIGAGNVTRVADERYPNLTVPGLVVLGGIAYVMDTTGLIHSCELNDPLHWPLLNVVGADYESDPGVALVKYLNYAIAFGTYTMQFFYDAGISDGSPLRPYLNANMKVGCDDAATIVNIGPTLMWVSRTREFNRQVMILNGLLPQVISTPAIDKLLNNASYSSLRAIAGYSDGHLYYILTNPDAPSNLPSLVYDTTNKGWFEWTDSGGSKGFNYAAACSTLQESGYLLLHPSNGMIYKFDASYLNDAGTPFPVTLQTAKVDAENNRNKFWGQTEIIGDRNVGTPLIQTTDDDYQTFNTGRMVDMNTPRAVLYRNGASRRRAWKVTQTDSNLMRLEALEVTYEQGM